MYMRGGSRAVVRDFLIVVAWATLAVLVGGGHDGCVVLNVHDGEDDVLSVFHRTISANHARSQSAAKTLPSVCFLGEQRAAAFFESSLSGMARVAVRSPSILLDPPEVAFTQHGGWTAFHVRTGFSTLSRATERILLGAVAFLPCVPVLVIGPTDKDSTWVQAFVDDYAASGLSTTTVYVIVGRADIHARFSDLLFGGAWDVPPCGDAAVRTRNEIWGGVQWVCVYDGGRTQNVTVLFSARCDEWDGFGVAPTLCAMTAISLRSALSIPHSVHHGGRGRVVGGIMVEGVNDTSLRLVKALSASRRMYCGDPFDADNFPRCATMIHEGVPPTHEGMKWRCAAVLTNSEDSICPRRLFQTSMHATYTCRDEDCSVRWSTSLNCSMMDRRPHNNAAQTCVPFHLYSVNVVGCSPVHTHRWLTVFPNRSFRVGCTTSDHATIVADRHVALHPAALHVCIDSVVWSPHGVVNVVATDGRGSCGGSVGVHNEVISSLCNHTTHRLCRYQFVFRGVEVANEGEEDWHMWGLMISAWLLLALSLMYEVPSASRLFLKYAKLLRELHLRNGAKYVRDHAVSLFFLCAVTLPLVYVTVG